MAERVVLSQKGIYKGLPILNSLDLVHDASTFRPGANEFESNKAQIEKRGYAIVNGVLPVAGILRIVNNEKKELEDYLITYPFTTFKPGANLIPLGKRRLTGEENLNEAVEYDTKLNLDTDNLNDISVGGGVSPKELLEAYKELMRNKEDYPELYSLVNEVVGDTPDVQLIKAVFVKYAKEDRRNIKDLRSLGLKIRSVEDLERGMPLSLFLEEVVKSGLKGTVRIGEYEAKFIPSNLIETGVLIEQGTKKVYEFVSFFPEKVRTEGGRAVASRINASDELYSTRAILLKVLNKQRLKALKSGNGEVKEKVLQSIQKAIENTTSPNAKKLLERTKEAVEKGDWERLEKALAKMYVENRKKFEEAILQKPIVDTNRLLKEYNGRYFLSTPLAGRGYSLNFAKKLYEAFDDENGETKKVVVGLFTHIPRLTLDEKSREPVVQKLYKPIAFIVGEYEGEGVNIDLKNIEIIRSKPEFIFDKFDRRIAGAIQKRSAKALKLIKDEIIKEKSLAPIYVKFLDEAIKQVESGKVEGVVKEYIDAVSQAKNELSILKAVLKTKDGQIGKELAENVRRLAIVKEISEKVSYEELNDTLKEIKNAYWNTIGIKNEIAKALFYSPKETKPERNEQVSIESEPEIVEIDGIEDVFNNEVASENEEEEDFAQLLLEAIEEAEGLEEEKSEKKGIKRKR